MTLTSYLFETGPEGTALSNGNSGSVASSIGAGSSAVFAAASKARGSFGARFINGVSANAYRRYPLVTPSTQWQFSGVVTLPASTPPENVAIVSFPRADGSGRLMLGINANARIYVTGPGGAGITDATSVGLTPGGKYRIAIQCVGGSTTTSNVTIKVYSEASGVWTTQVGSTWESTTYNTGTEEVIGADLGIITSRPNSYTVGWDDIQVNDGAGSEIPDLIEKLSTPVVTLGATTNPSTVGGSNGAQVVTWSAVPNAVSYDAYIASGQSPTQESFTLVQTNVTSPYTFAGLEAGEWSFGIKAKV